MSTTELSNSGCTISESNMLQLNVPAMIKPILDNYDMHVNNFIRFLRDKLDIHLIYQGPDDIHQHILQKTMYACSVYCKPKKILKDLFPVMIGSRLDIAIRHQGIRSFKEPLDENIVAPTFQNVDIGRGFFIINGFLRHLPYFYTSDPTNTHVIQRKIVRVYSYNGQDRGKELSFYMREDNKRKCGDVVVVHNDGSESYQDPHFFKHCPYPVHLTAYMKQLYRDDLFDIDHLGNKMVVSPGHMFTKLFIKYLYGPLREKDWKLVKSKEVLVRNSIENGFLLHVLSRKTVYFKEGKSAGKMTNEPQESHREIGANGEVFIEKNMGCYREVLTQTYPLNPYLLYMIVRQMSKKVKHSTIDSFHPSYENFLCMLGVFETKNIGRTTMMVRDTIVSTNDDLDPVYQPNETFWQTLNLEPQESSPYYVVVNEACIPVSRASFFRIDLFQLKMTFGTIECYERGKFIVIRFKMGLIMKKLPGMFEIWVTPYDIKYWVRRFCVENFFGTSYHVDLNRFFNHTAFPKDILAFNALKNAILATDPKYALYFMDTVSAYFRGPSIYHKVLIPPIEDGVSKHFALMIPQVIVTYMSFKGCTQEDCIVKRHDLDAFDCYRFYTLRFKLEATAWVKFYPVYGDVDEESDLIGTIVSGEPLNIEPFSIHVRIDKISSCEYRIRFVKEPFRVLQHFITGDKFLVSLEQKHVSDTGDKLCSLHGQKGVIRVMDNLPILDKSVIPDLIINPYCLFRMTPGQILEANGRDSKWIGNSKGKAFYGKTFYFPVAYYACEHLYAPEKCVLDRVMNQPVKGRSRGGGMKLGNMEVNALRGNGIASCFEEKFFEDGDRVQQMPTLSLPKSINLVTEDAKFFKCNLEYDAMPSIIMQ